MNDQKALAEILAALIQYKKHKNTPTNCNQLSSGVLCKLLAEVSFHLFHDLTIGKTQATIHLNLGKNPPNPLVCSDPDCDPSVRESVWTQWTNRCEIPYFLLTERTYCTQNRQKSRTDISWQS